MKFFLPLAILILIGSFASAITVDEVVKLTRLHTSDDLIIQAIEKSKLNKPLASKDIVYLKEQGVSDRVISALMDEPREKKEEAWRIYHKTDKNGKRVTVVTNLDENGHRMGGDLPVEPAVESEAQNAYGFPSEIHVTIEHEPPPEPDRYEEPPPPPMNGIPVYDYPSFYPLSPVYGGGFFPRFHSHHFFPFSGSMPSVQTNWRFDAGYRPTHPIPSPGSRNTLSASPGFRPTR